MRKELEKLKKEELINKILGLQEELQMAQNEIVKLKDDLEFTKTFLKSAENEVSNLKDEEKFYKERTEYLENELEKRNEDYRELHLSMEYLKLDYEHEKEKNKRGAGRKKKYSDKQIAEILEARKQNKSMRVIAKEFNCSLGLVQKIITEHEEKLK